MSSFKELGVNDALCAAIDRVKWKVPTEIQKMAIPPALEGRDISGLAKTGSGKTGAFTIPIIQALMNNTKPFFALVLTPTRELAAQIQTEFKGLGEGIGLTCCVLIGGFHEQEQANQLQKKPHIIIATPGRFLKHVQTTKGFNANVLKGLEFLVMDEADRMLSSQFEHDVDKILFMLPKKRHTYLFSATNTDKVSKLQKASLQNPVIIKVDEKHADSDQLKEYTFLTPFDYRAAYLVWLLKQVFQMSTPFPMPIEAFDLIMNKEDSDKQARSSVIIFVQTKVSSNQLTLFLKLLGLNVLPLNANMTQEQRLASLNKMKMRKIDVMVATDVAARGLDIPDVDLVIHYDLPDTSKTYTHRAGRTARAGKSGVSVVMVNQYNALSWTTLEEKIQRKLSLFVSEDKRKMIHKEVLEDFVDVKRCYQDAELSVNEALSGRNKRKAFNVSDAFKKTAKKRRLEKKE